MRFLFSLIFMFCFFGTTVHAQEQAGSDYELTFQVGKMLPSQIDGVTEIMSAWSIKGAYRLSAYNLELGYLSGTGEGSTWSDISLSARADFPLEDILGQIYVGLDLIEYTGTGISKQSSGGGHIGGGISMKIARGMWFRSDMKFNFNPGVSMFIMFGLTFDFEGESGGA